MVTNEEMLEQLYELLTLYFEISPGGGIGKAFGGRKDVEPQLDRAILKEDLLARITSLIIETVITDI